MTTPVAIISVPISSASAGAAAMNQVLVDAGWQTELVTPFVDKLWGATLERLLQIAP